MRQSRTTVMGTAPSVIEVRDGRGVVGIPVADSAVRTAPRVALLGQTVVINLFVDENPVGKTLRINQSPFLVIGELAAKGQSLDGRDQDDTVLIPVTTALNQLFGSQFQGTVRFMMAGAISPQAMGAAEREMTQLLRQRHHLQERN